MAYHRTGNRLLLCVAVTAIPFTCSNSALANQSLVFEEILITATKQPKGLQKVPITVTVLSKGVLDKYDVFTTQDLENNLSGFTMDKLGTNAARFAIRGSGSDNTSPGQEFSTALYQDGIYASTNSIAAMPLYDIERIEVLKGPQGTLWGKNSIGGNINIIPNKPTSNRDIFLASTVGNYGLINVEGTINIPSSTETSHRLAFNSQQRDGYAKNVTTGDDLEDIDYKAARYSLSSELTPALYFDLSLDYAKSDSNGRAGHVVGQKPFNLNGDPITSGRSQVWHALSERFTDVRKTYDSDPGFSDLKTWGVRAEVNWELTNGLQLTSLTAYRDIKSGFFHEDDGLSVTLPEVVALAYELQARAYDFGLGTSDDSNQWSTEIRLADNNGPLTWTAGFFYSVEDGYQKDTFRVNTMDCRTGRVASPEECAANVTLTRDIININNTTTDTAVFGEATYAVTPQLSLTTGARWTNSDKDYSWTNQNTETNTLISGDLLTAPKTAEDDWNNITWRVIADYQFTGEVMTYASIATGFKPGGYGAFVSSTQAAVPSDEETNTSYELGLKSTWLDQRMQLNAALFRSDLDGLQSVQVNGAKAIFVSVDTVKVDGVEMELSMLLPRGFSTGINYTYLDTLVKGWPGIEDQELVLQRAPENEVNVNLKHSTQLNSGSILEFAVQYNHRSEVYDDPDNSSGEVRPSRSVVNAYAQWNSPSSGLIVSLWAKNLTDEEYFNRITDSFDSSSVNHAPPRTYGLTMGYHF